MGDRPLAVRCQSSLVLALEPTVPPGRRPHTTHPPGRGASIRREAEANKLLELPGIRSENLNRLFSFGYLPANYYSIHYSKNLYVN